jgi:hypothetical protein
MAGLVEPGLFFMPAKEVSVEQLRFAISSFHHAGLGRGRHDRLTRWWAFNVIICPFIYREIFMLGSVEKFYI